MTARTRVSVSGFGMDSVSFRRASMALNGRGPGLAAPVGGLPATSAQGLGRIDLALLDDDDVADAARPSAGPLSARDAALTGLFGDTSRLLPVASERPLLGAEDSDCCAACCQLLLDGGRMLAALAGRCNICGTGRRGGSSVHSLATGEERKLSAACGEGAAETVLLKREHEALAGRWNRAGMIFRGSSSKEACVKAKWGAAAVSEGVLDGRVLEALAGRCGRRGAGGCVASSMTSLLDVRPPQDGCTAEASEVVLDGLTQEALAGRRRRGTTGACGSSAPPVLRCEDRPLPGFCAVEASDTVLLNFPGTSRAKAGPCRFSGAAATSRSRLLSSIASSTSRAKA
mmetsp:Transcript_40679/g.116864  ORF Transcript_40679/g.116864 Transcript_40679/m.116864 type:complete len:344 (+) Transcript_40679:771-1802(+)